MTQPRTNRIPAPVYAAAGAGELALQQLRRLPAVVTDLSTRVAAEFGGRAVVTGVELRQKATETFRTANQTATGLREKANAGDLDLERLREAANLDKLREVATRNAAVVLAAAEAAQERARASAQVAQARALATYAELVARGERVVGAGVLEAADTVNADIEATEATAPAATVTTAADVPTPAEVAEIAEAKPVVKRTRATKATATKATATKATATAATEVKPVTPSAKLPKATKRIRPAAE